MIAVVAAMAASTLAGILVYRASPAAGARASSLALTLIFRLVLPFLIVCTLPALRVEEGVIGGLVIAYVTLGIVGLLAWWIGSRVLALPRAGVGTLVVCSVLANTGYFGLPVVTALLGHDDLPAAIAYDSLVSGPMLALVAMSIGVAFGRHGENGALSYRRVLLRNPPLWACVVGLLLPASAIPGGLEQTAEDSVWLLLGLGFLALGAILAAELADAPPRDERRGIQVAVAVGLRLAVAPALYLGLAALVGDVPPAFRLEAAMPVGVNTLVVAHVTGLDLGVCATAIAVSTTIAAAVGVGWAIF